MVQPISKLLVERQEISVRAGFTQEEFMEKAGLEQSLEAAKWVSGGVKNAEEKIQEESNISAMCCRKKYFLCRFFSIYEKNSLQFCVF